MQDSVTFLISDSPEKVFKAVHRALIDLMRIQRQNVFVKHASVGLRGHLNSSEPGKTAVPVGLHDPFSH